jgi:chromosome partitioning protein
MAAGQEGTTVSGIAPAGMGAQVPKGSRSPELIEAGMVYVDPEPEIGSPPRAAGWVEQPAPRLGPDMPRGGRVDAAGPSNPRDAAATVVDEPTPVPDSTQAGSDIGGEAAEPPVLSEAGDSTGPTTPDAATTAETGDAPRVGPVADAGITTETGADAHTTSIVSGGAAPPPPAPSKAGVGAEATEVAAGGEGVVAQEQAKIGSSPHSGASPEPASPAEANDASGSSDAADGSLGPAPAEVPWKEPALPMAWPPGMAPPDRGERWESLDEEPVDRELMPEPDPAWPRLFGQSAGSQAPAGAAEVDDGNAPASGQPEGTGPTAGPQPSPGPVPSTGAAAPQSTPIQGVGNEGGIDPAGQANASVAQRNEVGEVDLWEPPASPRSIDVSRETLAGGGAGMDPGQENEALDEAAVAVRDAVSRAAAEAGGDVSRETDLTSTDVASDAQSEELRIDPEAAARSARVTFRIDRDALNRERRVVAIANQKGGVGKSTTAVNIGAYLALAGARVLVVDLDPQGNASTGLGLDHREIEPSIYDVLTGETSPTAAIRATGVDNLHVLPSTIDLAGAEVELVSAMSRETRLRRALESIDHQYDSILIDCPPSLGLLTVNALAAADELLIPIQCEYYALEGLGQLLRNVELVRANLNPDLRIGGIVLTMYDGRTRLALQVVDEVRKHFTDVVYQTVVPRSVRLSEAPGYGLPIALYDPLSRGGIAYRDLTFELAERSGLLAPTGEGAS